MSPPRILFLLLALVAVSTMTAPSPVRAADPDTTAARLIPSTAEITLVDGSRLLGRITGESPDSLQIETASLGRLVVSRAQVASVHYVGSEPTLLAPAPNPKHPDWRSDPDYNSVLLVPTPETLPKGSVYYRNFELFFNNFGYAPSDDLNLSMGFLFPIDSDVQILALGAKWRLLSRETYPVGIALAGAGSAVTTDGNWEWLGTLSAIAGVGNRSWSINGAFYYALAEGDDEHFFLLAGDLQLGTGFKLLAEYGSSAGALLESDDFNGFIDVGFRVFWNEVSFTLTGMRPLEVDGSFIAFPLAVFSGHF